MTLPYAGPPAHLADHGATRTRCGIKLHDSRSDPCPYVRADHAARHVDGYGLTICPTCAATPPATLFGSTT